ncbi:MAG: RnfABCDGE type electron transport complex subunit D [Pseudomonadota bacterium]
MKPVTTTAGIMQQVMLALVPGTLVLAWYFGIGILVNLVAAGLTAVLAEALCLKARGLPLQRLRDMSALLAGLLLGLCLPPLLPLWMVVVGTAFALVVGKHLYGGLGQNPFNPAMVGYALLVVSFPLAMSLWPGPNSHLPPGDLVGYKLGFSLADGVAMATPLDAFRFRDGITVEEFWRASPVMAEFAGIGWQWVNLAFLAGGLYLVYRRVCDWIMPLTLLGTLAVLALLFYDSGSSSSLGSPLFHLLSGSTMLAAFFIVTDPVTSPDSRRGKMVFAAGVAALIFLIRSHGAYPDGIAFAVLLMNTLTPLIDQTRWRLPT